MPTHLCFGALKQMAAEVAVLARKRNEILSAIVHSVSSKALSLCSQEGKLSDDISPGWCPL